MKMRERINCILPLLLGFCTHEVTVVLAAGCGVVVQVISRRSRWSVTLGLRRNWAEQWVMLDFIQFGNNITVIINLMRIISIESWVISILMSGLGVCFCMVVFLF